jgi:hypothetical protein
MKTFTQRLEWQWRGWNLKYWTQKDDKMDDQHNLRRYV